MTELVNEIKTMSEEMVADMIKAAEKGTKAPAKRARKISLQLVKKLKEYRKNSLAEEKAAKEAE